MSPKTYSTLSESIVTLNGLLERAETTRNRLGYFAAFVRKYANSLLEEQQQDPSIQTVAEHIIANFVSHYENYEVMNEPVKSWMTAFNESSSWWCTLPQQFLMSITCFARITLPKSLLDSYDASPEDSKNLQQAYLKCFKILGQDWDKVLKQLSSYSAYLHRINKNKQFNDLELNDFEQLGKQSLVFTKTLFEATPGERQRKLNLLDYDVNALVESIAYPKDINKLRMKLIRLGERKSVREVIQLISKA